MEECSIRRSYDVDKKEVICLLKTYEQGQSWTIVDSYLNHYYNGLLKSLDYNIKDNVKKIIKILTSDKTML